MKRKLLIAGLCFFIMTGFARHDESLLSYKTCFDNSLKDWAASFKNFDLEKFAPSSSFKISDASAINTSDSGFIGYMSLLSPVFYFSNDKQRFVDIYGHTMNLGKKESNASGGQEIMLYDLQAKTEKRILFCKALSQIQDVAWLSDTRLILAGCAVESKKKAHPLIYVVDLDKGETTMYQSKDNDCVELTAYTSSKLQNLNYRSE